MQEALPPSPRKKRRIGLWVVASVLIIIVTVASLFSLFYLGIIPWTFKPREEGRTGVIFTCGIPVQVTSKSVNYSGGAISVADSSSPLYGLEIEIPSAATVEAISFDVSYADVSDVRGLPEKASAVSKMIYVETSGSEVWNKYKVFDKAVEVTLPYDPSLVSGEEPVRFYYYDDQNNVLDSAGFLSQNSTTHTITFYTRTFSSFIAIKLALQISKLLGLEFSVDTGFRPITDGWFITNYGSYLESGGICMGMVSFARYYYMHKKSVVREGLYEKYREGDPDEWRDDATAIQLATRAHMAESDVWDQTWTHEIAQQVPTSRSVALSWLHGMVVTGSPQLIGIYQEVANGRWVAGHAILTYRYANGRFDIYDPNFPGTVPGTDARQIPFTYGTGFTRVYSSGATAGAGRFQYNIFLHWGYKAFHPLNAFDQLYASAENEFEDDTLFPTVTITSASTTPEGTTPEDTDGDDIRDTTENKATISGTITGGLREVESTLIFISNQKFEVSVVDGVFSQEVPLYQGDNDLIILATDENTFTNWAGYLRDTIKSTASVASLTITLTWGQDLSDVDLHVLEPEVDGRHIYYGNMGKETELLYPYLDIDNTRGYGPEHYYATENMTLPNYPGPDKSLYGIYQVRVHYYADHDENEETTQPITWHLTVRYLAFKIEVTGVEFWVDYSMSGHLTTEDTYDTGNFFNTGPSWSEIYYVEYPEPSQEDYNIPPPPQNVLPEHP